MDSKWCIDGFGNRDFFGSTMSVSKSDDLLCAVTVEDGYGGVATAETSFNSEYSTNLRFCVDISTEPTTQDVTCPNNPFDIDGDVVEFHIMVD